MKNENPKHTAGQWEMGKCDGHFHIIAEDGGNTWHIADIYDNPNINAKANAALIAAAPELLAQLKQLYAAHKFSLDTGAAYVVDEMAVTFIAAAIAKAEGK